MGGIRAIVLYSQVLIKIASRSLNDLIKQQAAGELANSEPSDKAGMAFPPQNKVFFFPLSVHYGFLNYIDRCPFLIREGNG